MILIKTNLENRRKINYLGWIQPGVDRKRIVKGKKEREEEKGKNKEKNLSKPYHGVPFDYIPCIRIHHAMHGD